MVIPNYVTLPHPFLQRGITLFTVSHRKSLWKHHEVQHFVHAKALKLHYTTWSCIGYDHQASIDTVAGKGLCVSSGYCLHKIL